MSETEWREQDAAWVARVLAGDPGGFDPLVRRYRPVLERLLRAMVRNREDAEDLLQETFLRTYRFLHRYDTGRPFGPWILRIGANLARNHLRGRRGRREVALDEPPGEGPFEGEWLADSSTMDTLASRDRLERARGALALLPDEQRVVLELRVLAEMSYQEIATTLAIPIGTVMSRLNRGRRRLRDEAAPEVP